MLYTIDTAAAIRKLEKAGCDGKVANAIVETISTVHGEVATKADLEHLEHALTTRFEASIAKLQSSTQSDIGRLEASTQSDIGRLEASMKSDIGHLEASMKSDVERLETSIKSDVERLETSIKSDVKRLETSIATLETSTKTAIALSESRVTSKLWWAIGLLVAILKALDYLLPALGG